MLGVGAGRTREPESAFSELGRGRILECRPAVTHGLGTAPGDGREPEFPCYSVRDVGPMKKAGIRSGTAKQRSASPAAPPPEVGSDAPKAPVDGGSAAKAQSEWFDKAAALFQARDFQAAMEYFEKAATGPQREVAHAARSYVRMCEQRLKAASPVLVTADDHYNYAIALMNKQAFAEADKHLQAALALAPQADHLYYAMALCRGVQGKLQDAHDHLKRAIELDPRNRIQARVDPDFADLIRQPLMEELLFPAKGR